MRGFQVVVGGGTSTLARKADVLYDFVPVDRYIMVSAAVIAVFNRNGQRKNRNQARIKWYIRKIGLEEFQRLVAEELTQPWALNFSIDMDQLMDIDEEDMGAVAPLEGELPEGYSRWRLTNVQPQVQRGYFAATIALTLGDLTPLEFRQVADVMRRFAGGRARPTLVQNLLLRNVPEESLKALYKALCDINLGQAGAGTITDVVSCPGTDSCSMAIASSRGLASALGEHFKALPVLSQDSQNVTLKLSGCPNGCGQHHIAAIGFSGASTRQHGKEVPSAELWLGGGVTDKGFRYGKLIGKVPTKNAPQLVDRLLEFYEAEKKANEPFQDYVDRMGAKVVGQRALAGLTEVAKPEQAPEMFMDWGAQVAYTVMRGEGECAV
ncbi:MAG: nitrite/sulfite reductase [Chloroflexi bacterium]|nr:nitrite/sulfite reductase [Chloroflexota bacterium]